MAVEVDGAEEAKGSETQEVVGDKAAQAEVAGDSGTGGDTNDNEWQKALAAKDEQIATLQGKVAKSAKTAEATEVLNSEIASLKPQMVDERTEFALRSVGARSVKSARALLDDHDGDIAALKEAEPWLFAQVGATSQGSSQQSPGMTGLEPAGVAGGSDDRYTRHWERIVGLTDEKEA